MIRKYKDMNVKEKEFVFSIYNKIEKYKIPITLKQAFQQNIKTFVETKFSNGKTEIVDPNIERYLVVNSFSYFLNNYTFIEIPKIGVLSFEPYYFQKELAKIILEPLKIVTEKSRQVGISTFFSLYALWRALYHEAENIDVVSLKQLKAQSFVSKMNATLNNLPSFLQTKVISKNTQYIKFEFPNKSTSMILSESQSENAGRSDSLSLLIIDEAAFMRSKRMIEGIIASAQPTLSKTGGQMIVVSTSNGTAGPGEWYYSQVQQAKYGDEVNTLFVPIGWFEVPDDPRIDGPKKGYNKELEEFVNRDYFNNKTVREEMENFFKPIGEKFYNKNEWLKKQFDDLGDVRFKQEVLRKFIVGGDKVFTEETLEKIQNKIREPISKNEFGNTEYKGLWFFKNPIKNARYIITVDVSSGTGKDFSAIQIFDIERYEQVCEYKGHITTKNFAILIKKLALYYNEAFVVVESNSIGEAVFNELYFSDDAYSFVYKKTKTNNGITRSTGWETNVKTRKLIINDLIDWITSEELFKRLKIYSRRLWEELCTFIWTSGGKAEHAPGSNDDLIISMALAIHLRGKAEHSGESFLVTEDGQIVESSKDKNKEEEEFNIFDEVLYSGETEEQMMERKSLKWLLS